MKVVVEGAKNAVKAREDTPQLGAKILQVFCRKNKKTQSIEKIAICIHLNSAKRGAICQKQRI